MAQDAKQPAYVIKHGAPRCQRFIDQRWLLDQVIRANGIDWDQPRSFYLSGPCGAEAGADFAGLRARVQKLADAANAFEAIAKRREARAKEFEEQGALVSARDNYFMAAIHWGGAMWTLDESSEQNCAYNQRKRECYASYARLAANTVEEVWIPFGDTFLPAWFHLPYDYDSGTVPAVVSIPGMDSFKESGVSLNGDKWLSRGMAVLSIDGPGQYESPLLGIYFSMQNWEKAATAAFDWLAARKDVDASRIGVTGTSFGSMFSTISAASESRYKACVVNAPCLEPGCHTIFQEASPTFKQRFMFMSDIQDEAEFDDFRRLITWEGYAQKIKVPYLCLTGESDELSPLAHTERMFGAMDCPRQLVVYQDSRHAIGTVPSVNMGPFPQGMMADWMLARLNDQPIENERWFVEASGRISKTKL
jgi:dienelactone hydrolase